jgi:hypothetical protein
MDGEADDGSEKPSRQHQHRLGIVKLSNGTLSNTPYLGTPNLISESPQHRSARHAFLHLEAPASVLRRCQVVVIL